MGAQARGSGWTWGGHCLTRGGAGAGRADFPKRWPGQQRVSRTFSHLLCPGGSVAAEGDQIPPGGLDRGPRGSQPRLRLRHPAVADRPPLPPGRRPGGAEPAAFLRALAGVRVPPAGDPGEEEVRVRGARECGGWRALGCGQCSPRRPLPGVRSVLSPEAAPWGGVSALPGDLAESMGSEPPSLWFPAVAEGLRMNAASRNFS